MLTVYSTPWCGDYKRLTAQQDREGVAYTTVDIEHDEQAAASVTGVNGGNATVPTVVLPAGTALTTPSLKDLLARVG